MNHTRIVFYFIDQRGGHFSDLKRSFEFLSELRREIIFSSRQNSVSKMASRVHAVEANALYD